MLLVSRVPERPLSDFVAVLWYSEEWKPQHRERHMPDGSAGILVSLQDGKSGANGIVSGPRSESFVISASDTPNTLIGAQFTHGGAAVFFDVPLSDLRNTHAPLDEVVGPSSAVLREQLLELRTPDQRLDLFESWLAKRLRGRSGPEPAIAWAVRRLQRPHTRVADVAADIGRSSRWFIDRFASDVGLTPKVFSRVQRFQAALRCAHRHASVNLADLAASAGYFDQAHLSHEFTMLAGMSPSALLAGRTAFLNHVVDHG
jgi:AraC-like DNA-binding protein